MNILLLKHNRLCVCMYALLMARGALRVWSLALSQLHLLQLYLLQYYLYSRIISSGS